MEEFSHVVTYSVVSPLFCIYPGLFFSRFRGCRAGTEHLPTEFRDVLSRVYVTRGRLQNCQTDFRFSTPSPGGALVTKKVFLHNISGTGSAGKPKFSGSIGILSWYHTVKGTPSQISTSGLTDVQIFRGTQTGRSLAGVLSEICKRDRRHCTRDERNCALNETPTYRSRTVRPPGGSKVGSFFVVSGLIGGIAPFPHL